MIDIGMGEWSKEYDGYMLMKFTGAYDFQQCFLDGKLFFNTSDFFRNVKIVEEEMGMKERHL